MLKLTFLSLSPLFLRCVCWSSCMMCWVTVCMLCPRALCSMEKSKNSLQVLVSPSQCSFPSIVLHARADSSWRFVHCSWMRMMSFSGTLGSTQGKAHLGLPLHSSTCSGPSSDCRFPCVLKVWQIFKGYSLGTVYKLCSSLLFPYPVMHVNCITPKCCFWRTVWEREETTLQVFSFFNRAIPKQHGGWR